LQQKGVIFMPEKTVPVQEPSSISMLAGWLRQGTESFFASQRILMDLVARQNAHTVSAFQERLGEARKIASTAVTEMAGEGISNFIAAQRVLLNLAQRENEIFTTVVKERIGGPPPVAAVTDLFSRGIDTVIGMQQHFLTMAARQTDEWIDATKSGTPFDGIHLTALARESMETFVRSQKKFLDVLAEETAHATGKETNGKVHAAKKTELTELARQSAEAYIDAQKKLLDVAAQQLKVNAKTAREAVGAMNLLPAETLGELAKHTVAGLVESEQELLDVVIKQARKAPIVRAEPKAHAAKAQPKPKKRAGARRARVAVTV
jgi:NADH dehydrogenase/NADH:ubiquinone oxidoreductase subunit G